MRRINERGLGLIKSFEDCRFAAYLPTPDDVPTIGYGHTKGVKLGDTCTQEEADAWLLEDLAEAEACVEDAVQSVLTDNEFAACVSLAFNIGCEAFRTSTLAKRLNAADYDGARAQFLRWDKQAGRALAGLSRRRRAEAELFDQEHA